MFPKFNSKPTPVSHCKWLFWNVYISFHLRSISYLSFLGFLKRSGKRQYKPSTLLIKKILPRISTCDTWLQKVATILYSTLDLCPLQSGIVTCPILPPPTYTYKLSLFSVPFILAVVLIYFGLQNVVSPLTWVPCAAFTSTFYPRCLGNKPRLVCWGIEWSIMCSKARLGCPRPPDIRLKPSNCLVLEWSLAKMRQTAYPSPVKNWRMA